MALGPSHLLHPTCLKPMQHTPMIQRLARSLPPPSSRFIDFGFARNCRGFLSDCALDFSRAPDVYLDLISSISHSGLTSRTPNNVCRLWGIAAILGHYTRLSSCLSDVCVVYVDAGGRRCWTSLILSCCVIVMHLGWLTMPVILCRSSLLKGLKVTTQSVNTELNNFHLWE